MARSEDTNRLLLWRNLVATLALVALAAALAWMTHRFHHSWDWTSNGRYTLSQASRRLLSGLHGSVRVTAYVSDNRSLRRSIRELVDRYRRYKPDLSLRFVDPATHPQQTRKLGIPKSGALMLEYGGHRDQLRVLNEQSITNALLRLAGGGQRWIAFLHGQGERSPFGKANSGISRFAAELRQRGLHVQNLDLAQTPAVPDNTSVLVIAAPQRAIPAGQLAIIQGYVRRGGNLLWLSEPGGQLGLKPLAAQLGIRFLPGVVLSTRSQLLGVHNPMFVVVDHYPPQAPVTRGLAEVTLLPVVAALVATHTGGWHSQPFLRSSANSWSEAGPLNNGPVRFDPKRGDHRGPLVLGLTLSRPAPAAHGPRPATDQRVVVTGDGDFLSNAYLDNGANLQLGLNLVHWLAHDDRFIAIPAHTARDLHLRLSTTKAAVIAFGFPFVLPALLIGAGFVIRHRRRRRSAPSPRT